jgi:hypothetical protein
MHSVLFIIFEYEDQQLLQLSSVSKSTFFVCPLSFGGKGHHILIFFFLKRKETCEFENSNSKAFLCRYQKYRAPI